MKSTYVDTRSANVGDIRCLFALASDSTTASVSNGCVHKISLLQYPIAVQTKFMSLLA